ncbi:SEC-C metal-binding domain-containing protein [Vallitalea okinawensis]|uniref:SEC-C metal-binding domain-containing protein n=1 Tax=Vallitalea okinawensis TaxID=2078660 RepID=UPI000CFCE7C9|nr:SEC-C metal-binding domain-containing protein [Vallitalea okinawensis]
MSITQTNKLIQEYGYDQKMIKDLFPEMKEPFKLNDFLNKMPKAELDQIRRNLDIKGVSQLKKGDLINALYHTIDEKLPHLLSYIDDRQYQFLYQLSTNAFQTIDDFDDIPLIYFYRQTGLVYTCTYENRLVYVMPEEIRSIITELPKTDIISRNEEWVRLAQGMLYYYGVLEEEKLIELIEKNSKYKMDREAFLKVLDIACIIYEQIIRTDYGFSFCTLLDPEFILTQQKKCSKDYNSVSYKELYKAGELDFIENSYHVKQLFSFLMSHYDISYDMVDDIVTGSIFDIKNLIPLDNILLSLQSAIQIDNPDLLKSITSHLYNIKDHTPLWSLKGYSEKEYDSGYSVLVSKKKSNVVQLTNKKISRNAPCPCGSQIKYKFCCGQEK